MKKVELLAPGGDLEKIKMAIEYGADAVYFGGSDFSLRASSSSLDIDSIKEALKYCHERGKKAYLALNIFAHNQDIEAIRKYLENLANLDIDAFIVSDPGVISLIKEIIPNAEIHLSTQANTTNYLSCNFWNTIGVSRVVLARELSLTEIKNISDNAKNIEIEAFVHGAMCISYSGRCLISNYMTNRDANKGECAHPCRWTYSLVEKQRPKEDYPIMEDDRGTYILNSKDLCMIKNIKDIIEAGVCSLKIEGRMKSSFYVATIVKEYRREIDRYYDDPKNYLPIESSLEEVSKVSNRFFTTGFYYNKPSDEDSNYETSSYNRDYDFVGVVLSYDDENKEAVIEQRNKFSVGETVEIFGPDIDYFDNTVLYIKNKLGESVESAPHPQEILKINVENPVKENYILRKRKN